MKKQRKAWIAMGILVLSMFFAACGSDGGNDVPDFTPTPTSTPTLTPTPTSTPTPTPSPTPEYAKGTITDTGFESEWIGIRFTTPETVVMATQEEMDAVMMAGGELMYGDAADTVVDYASLTTVQEMMATHIYGANVLLQVEKLPLLYSQMSTDQYLAVVRSNLEASSGTSGIVYVFDENTYVIELAGQEYTGLSVAADYGVGVWVYQEYLVRKMGDRMVVFAFTYREDTLEELDVLMNAFAPY